MKSFFSKSLFAASLVAGSFVVSPAFAGMNDGRCEAKDATNPAHQSICRVLDGRYNACLANSNFCVWVGAEFLAGSCEANDFSDSVAASFCASIANDPNLCGVNHRLCYWRY